MNVALGIWQCLMSDCCNIYTTSVSPAVYGSHSSLIFVNLL